MLMWRGLLVGTALVLIAPRVSQVRADEAEERAVRAIEKLGGKVTRDERQRGRLVVAVELSGQDVTDATLQELAPLKQLRSVEPFEAKVTNAYFKELRTTAKA